MLVLNLMNYEFIDLNEDLAVLKISDVRLIFNMINHTAR